MPVISLSSVILFITDEHIFRLHPISKQAHPIVIVGVGIIVVILTVGKCLTVLPDCAWSELKPIKSNAQNDKNYANKKNTP
jgi:hypothetical protein